MFTDTQTTTPRSRRQPARRGLAVIEFAVMLPLIVLIVFATIEATSMIFLKQSLEIAAYEGARVALVPQSDANNVIGVCNEVLETRSVAGATISVEPTDFPNADYGTFIRVSITASCDINSVLTPWLYRGRVLTADVEMMKEN